MLTARRPVGLVVLSLAVALLSAVYLVPTARASNDPVSVSDIAAQMGVPVGLLEGKSGLSEDALQAKLDEQGTRGSSPLAPVSIPSVGINASFLSVGATGGCDATGHRRTLADVGGTYRLGAAIEVRCHPLVINSLCTLNFRVPGHIPPTNAQNGVESCAIDAGGSGYRSGETGPLQGQWYGIATAPFRNVAPNACLVADSFASCTFYTSITVGDYDDFVWLPKP